MIRARRTALLMGLVGVAGFWLAASAQEDVKRLIGTPGSECRVVNTYPEYWVDGRPFFEHAAAFFYHRIPRDRWEEELLRLKELVSTPWTFIRFGIGSNPKRLYWILTATPTLAVTLGTC